MKKIAFLAIFLLAALSGSAQHIDLQKQDEVKGTLCRIVTNHGEIVVNLYDDTPIHRDNFLKLVQNKFYDGLLFHRVIPKFMIQAGDPKSHDARPGDRLGEGTLDYQLPPEILRNHFHKRGALCAARLGDDVNPNRMSSPCQFYIVQGQQFSEEQLNYIEKRMGKRLSREQREIYAKQGGAPHLDGEYTVFGEVVAGMEVVDFISTLPTDKADRPIEDIRILAIEVMNK